MSDGEMTENSDDVSESYNNTGLFKVEEISSGCRRGDDRFRGLHDNIIHSIIQTDIETAQQWIGDQNTTFTETTTTSTGFETGEIERIFKIQKLQKAKPRTPEASLLQELPATNANLNGNHWNHVVGPVCDELKASMADDCYMYSDDCSQSQSDC